jgi:hypothetical protein
MTDKTIETLAASLLFALAFIFGPKLHKPGNVRRRSLFSFSAGAAVAYIFVHLSPELEGARKVFMEETAHLASHLAWYSVHVATMLGFVLFYGLDQFVMGLKPGKEQPHSEEKLGGNTAFWVHVGVLGAYAWLVSYLLVDTLEEGAVPIGLYAVAMVLHFLTVSHGLHREYGTLYDRKGAWLLAVCSLAGWASGMLVDFPKPIVAVLLGLIAGAVIVNTLIGELPREKEGRFFPFVFGAVFYTVLLLISV